jgi:hypothetical protein
MSKRMIISAIVFLMAVAVSYVAPEHSTALMYRLSVVSFALLLFASRAISMNIFANGSQSFGLLSAPAPSDHLLYR